MYIIEKLIKKPVKIGNAKGIIIPKRYIEMIDIDEEVEIIIYKNQIKIKKPSQKNIDR